MSLPPDEVMQGYLEFFSRLMVATRLMAYEKVPHKQIADLMDAAHQMPRLLKNADDFDEDVVRLYFADFDRRWPDPKGEASITQILNECVGEER